jgi:hypothetical protein
MASAAVVLVVLLLLMYDGNGSASASFIFDDPLSCNTTLLVNLEPPLRHGETFYDRGWIDETLALHWKGSNAYSRDTEEGKGRNEHTYGEMTSLGVRQLIHRIGLQDIDICTSRSDDGDDDEDKEPIIFYDLGSGAGRFVVQLFLENVADTAIGIELSQSRHLIALESWEGVQESLNSSSRLDSSSNKRVWIRNQDLLEADFSDGTHVYAASLCFPHEMKEALTRIIIQNSKKGKLKVVAALSDLQLLEEGEQGKRWKKNVQDMQMTWGRASVRIYSFIPE